jgi:hypothetical protein
MRRYCIEGNHPAEVTASYEIWLGTNRVAVREAGSALLALVDYLRGEGVSDADIVRLGNDEVAWRGAVYRARLTQQAAVP